MDSTSSFPTGKKTRLPRFRRSLTPPRMVLTNRDKRTLEAVYNFRVLTREQIERLLFAPDGGQDHPTKTSRVRKRLRLLYHGGFLDRLPMPVRLGHWAYKPVYRLTAKGADQVAKDLGVARHTIKYWGRGFDQDHRPSDASFLFLQHTLAINDIRIAMILSAKHEGYEISEWQDDSQLKQTEMKDYVSVKGRKLAVVPDAHWVIARGDLRAHLLLELDRATMSRKRWRMKVLGYQAYLQTGKYQARYKAKSLRILTVTTTPARLEGLIKVTTDSVGSFASRFWFTTIDQATDGKVLSVPIWWVAGEAERRSLLGSANPPSS